MSDRIKWEEDVANKVYDLDYEDCMENDFDEKDLTKLNELARLIYGSQGYIVEPGYDFQKAHHPQETQVFKIAVMTWNFWGEK